MNLYKPEKLRIGLKAYDSTILDESCNKIIEVVSNSDTKVVGPIPLPTKRRIYCVLRSPHVNKGAREHFEIRTHQRLLDIYKPSAQVIDSLVKIDIPAGVDVEIKL